MSRRTTTPKPSLQIERSGDTKLAEALQAALTVEDAGHWGTHGFHTYPAGLAPRAAGILLEALGAGPGARVLDPFIGGGTVAVEAMRLGAQALGNDLSPVAVLVATARTRLTTESDRQAFRSAARRITGAARDAAPSASAPPALSEWYDAHTLGELVALRQGVEAEADDDVRTLLQAVFSSILVKVSHQESDTRLRRAPRERPPGTTAVLFHKKARELGRRLESLRAAVDAATPPASIRLGDARELKLRRPADVVLTSPPYPTVYDYLPMQRLREHWLRLPDTSGAEIGARRAWRRDPRAAEARWRASTHAWMGAVCGALARDGVVVVVIGDGLNGRRVIDAGKATVQTSISLGLKVEATARVARPDHARATVRWEHAIALRRA